MATAQEHYKDLLARIYVWMAGGLEVAIVTGAQDVASLVPGQGLAIDLGAGFGMHAIPLARGGYAVLAIDSSAELLQVLRDSSGRLSVRTIEDNLLDFRRHTDRPASLVVCFGDTLTHLESTLDVEHLCREVAASLEPGGRFMATFRDYTRPATGDARFVPVRSDAGRIHTCFLEEQPEHMLVHDIVHELDGDRWRMQVNSYRKLRLAPGAVADALRRAGLEPTVEPGPRGMVMVTATRP